MADNSTIIRKMNKKSDSKIFFTHCNSIHNSWHIKSLIIFYKIIIRFDNTSNANISCPPKNRHPLPKL